MNAADGEPLTLSALRRAGEANPAVRLLAAAATEMRSGADYAEWPDDPVGGALLTGETPAVLGEQALANTLAMIEDDQAAERRAEQLALHGLRHAAELLDLPAPARDAALRALQRRNWSFGGLGISRLPLIASGGAITELVRVEPGFGAAEHNHTADELTLVLSGAYNDGHERYGPGEISRATPGFLHAPSAEPGGLCYLMLISFGPARFTGAFGVLQRLTGFPWQPRPAETL